jgi:hypothetical protein
MRPQLTSGFHFFENNLEISSPNPGRPRIEHAGMLSLNVNPKRQQDFVVEEIDGQKYAHVSFEFILNQGSKIGPFPMANGAHGYLPKANNPNFVSFIAFDDGTPQNVDVGHTLSIFVGYVKQLIPKFEKFFV